MRMALEALETCDAAHISDGGRQWYDDKAVEEAITALKAALAEPQELDNGGKTGWPPGLLQDDCRGLSKWLASRPDARQRLREALAEPDGPCPTCVSLARTVMMDQVGQA